MLNWNTFHSLKKYTSILRMWNACIFFEILWYNTIYSGSTLECSLRGQQLLHLLIIVIQEFCLQCLQMYWLHTISQTSTSIAIWRICFSVWINTQLNLLCAVLVSSGKYDEIPLTKIASILFHSWNS